MRVFVTGVNGYLGGHVIQKLEEWGHTVIGMDSHNCLIHLTRGEQWAINKKSGLDSIESVIALGWYSSVGSKHPHLQYESAQHIIDLIDRLKGKNIQFIFPSSASVYGNQDDRLVTEETSVSPKCEYSQAKYRVEQYIRAFIPTNHIIFRFGSLMGKGVDGFRTKTELVVNAFAVNGFYRKHIPVWNPYDFKPLLHVQDGAELIVRAVNRIFPSGTYNACSQCAKAIEIAQYVAQVSGATVEEIKVDGSVNRSCNMSNMKLLEYDGNTNYKTYEETIEEFRHYQESATDKNMPWHTKRRGE